MILQTNAPAKINLQLHVLGRRDDGYHELEMLNASIDFCDIVTLEPKASGDLTISVESSVLETLPAELNDPAVNLAARMLVLVCEAIEESCSFHIHIQKQMPLGAGLAGGSSNAAAIFRLLDHYFKEHPKFQQRREDLLASFGH
ncbi:MAG: hypothetical protein KDD62_13545, partial [Bdellovibrionales bacterium]|nr:hypothetical protein [Bdellovibrionales bacterium]